MMQRKKAENRSNRRRKKDIDLINENDDAIAKVERYLFIYLSIYIFIYLFIYISIYLSIYLSI